MKESSSYPSCKAVMPNLEFIKKHGIDAFMIQQTKRIKLLARMIGDFDDGRSRSFFCRAACLRDLSCLESALNEAIRRIETGQVEQDDRKSKAKSSRKSSIITETGEEGRHHVHDAILQKAVKEAVRRDGIVKHVGVEIARRLCAEQQTGEQRLAQRRG